MIAEQAVRVKVRMWGHAATQELFKKNEQLAFLLHAASVMRLAVGFKHCFNKADGAVEGGKGFSHLHGQVQAHRVASPLDVSIFHHSVTHRRTSASLIRTSCYGS